MECYRNRTLKAVNEMVCVIRNCKIIIFFNKGNWFYSLLCLLYLWYDNKATLYLLKCINKTPFHGKTTNIGIILQFVIENHIGSVKFGLS